MTVEVLKGSMDHPELIRLRCNECGEESEDEPNTLVDSGWHWSIFQTATSFGTVGYSICDDCGGADELGRLGSELYGADEDRQRAIVERLANGVDLEKVLRDPQQTFDEFDGEKQNSGEGGA